MTRIRAVLFDFGNTLFAHDPLDLTIERLAASLGSPIRKARAAEIATEIDFAAQTPDELTHPRDLDATVWQQRWALLYGCADRDVPGLGAALLADMHSPDRWIPYATVGAVLRGLRANGSRVGVVSNTGWDVRAAIAHHGFGDLVDAYALSYEVGCTKPDPRIFRSACQSLGVGTAEALMVGDDPRADTGAVKAGLRVLLLPPTAPGSDNGIGGALALASGQPDHTADLSWEDRRG